jgi:shikimate dehydrogenase
MTLLLSGASRIYFIVGDPIAQVKSPTGVSQTMQERGLEALVIPAHVAPTNLNVWFQGIRQASNVDGVIVTIPHKFAAAQLCDSLSERSAFLGAVNVVRRNTQGRWHGDMVDGRGFTQALRNKSCKLQGARALVVGAGGAGSAIAHALLEEGVEHLYVHDADLDRRDGLIARLKSKDFSASAGTCAPGDANIIINATPIGMKPQDPIPVDISGLTPSMAVGCAITAPALTPLILKAQSIACTTVSGTEMFACVRDLMIKFLLDEDQT